MEVQKFSTTALLIIAVVVFGACFLALRATSYTSYDATSGVKTQTQKPTVNVPSTQRKRAA